MYMYNSLASRQPPIACIVQIQNGHYKTNSQFVIHEHELIVFRQSQPIIYSNLVLIKISVDIWTDTLSANVAIHTVSQTSANMFINKRQTC